MVPHGGPKGKPPPPHRCSHALCLCRACVMPATCVLQREDDMGDKGDGGSGMRTPPPRGHCGRVGRQRKEGAGRTTRPCPKGASAEQAMGGPPGVRPQER